MCGVWCSLHCSWVKNSGRIGGLVLCRLPHHQLQLFLLSFLGFCGKHHCSRFFASLIDETTMSIIGIEDIECTLDTHSSYSVTVNGTKINTLVTHTPSFVDQFITDILHTHRHGLDGLVIGLDVEWRPNANRNIENPVATLQLCVGHNCLVFQLIYASAMPQSLVDFLNNPMFRFVGVGIEEDLEKLLLDYHLRVANPVDLRPLAVAKLELNELKNAGLKSLASVVLGVEIQKPKRVTMSRWDAEWLTYDQIQYACVDAFLSLEIGKKLILES